MLAVFLVAFVVVIVFAVRLVTGPIEATNDYYADLSAGRYSEAYDDLCEPARAEVTESQFVERQESDQQTLGRVDDWDFDDTSFSDDDDDDDIRSVLIDAVTRGTVERGGSEYDARVSLRKEDGDWKVCATFEG